MRQSAENITQIYSKLMEREHESRTLSSLRDTLLPKLISGELRVPKSIHHRDLDP